MRILNLAVYYCLWIGCWLWRHSRAHLRCTRVSKTRAETKLYMVTIARLSAYPVARYQASYNRVRFDKLDPDNIESKIDTIHLCVYCIDNSLAMRWYRTVNQNRTVYQQWQSGCSLIALNALHSISSRPCTCITMGSSSTSKSTSFVHSVISQAVIKLLLWWLLIDEDSLLDGKKWLWDL